MMSSNGNVGRITGFIRREMTTSKPSGDVCRFELRHLPVGSKRGHDVMTANVPEKADPDWYEQTAAEIVSAAENDAEGIASGNQRYVVAVFRAKNPDKPMGRIAFMIAAADADEEGEIESEPATKQGVAAMAMRHLEATQRLLLTSFTSLMQSQARMVQSVTDENSKMREQRLEGIEVIEDLMSQRLERELAAKKSEAHVALLGDAAKDIKMLVPAVVNRLAGKNVVPSAENPVLELAKRIFESLSDEQKAKLLKTVSDIELTPKQQLGVGELFAALSNH